MPISKSLFTFIAILVSQVFAVEWIQNGSHFISSEILVIKFQNAPELGIEPPFELKSRTNIQRIISIYGNATLTPTFSNYEEFTQRHRGHDLHQYYNLQFNKPINIFKLKDELENIPSEMKTKSGYLKDDFVVDDTSNNSDDEYNSTSELEFEDYVYSDEN